MGRVPRHNFIEEALWGEAYNDYPLPIGEHQTISQPYIVALMTQSLGLTGQENILEIGTGSGYRPLSWPKPPKRSIPSNGSVPW